MYLASRSLYIVAAVIFFFTSVSQPALAEEATPRGINISIFHVAPGQEQNFEQVSTKFKAAADKVKSTPYIGYSPAFGNDGQYAFASSFSSFTQFANEENPMAQVYEAEELMEIGSLFQEATTATETFVIIPRPDLSVPAPEFEKPPEILMLIEVTLKNGTGPAYAAFLAQLKEASMATAPDLYWNAFQPGLGSGPVWRFGIAMNWADLDTPGKPLPQRLTEHFGERKGERIYQESLDAVESVHYSIARIRPDLSHAN